MSIDTYTNLKEFSLLAKAGITAASTTTINGLYGSFPIAVTLTNVSPPGNLAPTPMIQDAQGELTTFFNANTIPTTTSFPSGSVVTLLPSFVYEVTAGISNTSITFVGTSSSKFYVISSSNITLTNCTITTSGGVLSDNIIWLANTSITMTTINISNEPIPGIFVAATSITTTNSRNFSGRLFAGALNLTGALSFNGAVPTAVNTGGIVCYAKGTMILTQHGFVPIEKISVGDQVVTKGKIKHNTIEEVKPDLKPVLWISSFNVKNPTKKSKPICIQKNAFGTSPFQDLYVSPEHSLLIDNNLITAKRLVNGDTIYQADCEDVVYYHIEFEEHCAIFANGILAESYLDAENRCVFEPSVRLTKDEIERVNIKDIKIKHLRKCLTALKKQSTIPLR